MSEADRQRLLQRALALPAASEADFAGERRPPPDADPALLKTIDDTALRTKLVDSHIAEGLQSPKGPQRIASIIRVYPAFDAPPRRRQNGVRPRAPRASAPVAGLPSLEEMERLIARLREEETEAGVRLSAELDERVERLKREIPARDGAELDDALRELGEALSARRALAAQIRHEAFRRVESDGGFAPRVYLRFLKPS